MTSERRHEIQSEIRREAMTVIVVLVTVAAVAVMVGIHFVH